MSNFKRQMANIKTSNVERRGWTSGASAFFPWFEKFCGLETSGVEAE